MADTQLLILGNGFDLQCGLKSTFNDFEKKRKDAINEMGDEVRRGNLLAMGNIDVPNGTTLSGNSPEHWFRSHKLTLWDLILIDDHKTRFWYDIEECIRLWLVDRTHIMNVVHDNKTVSASFDMYAKASIEFPFWDLGISTAIRVYANRVYKWDGTDHHLLHILMAELNRYELAFAEYLKQQTEFNTSYTDFAVDLLTNLVTDGYDVKVEHPGVLANGQDLWDHQTKVLDFNYTTPLTEGPSIFNVHGTAIKENIIFGIDGTDVNPDDPNYSDIVKFTKTYRLMELSSTPHPPLVRSHNSISSGKTRYIKFFGHSLGHADYSYFQAIFDEIDLYEGQTQLIFYYNAKRLNDDGKDVLDTDTAEEMFEKVNNLISSYGETLDNKDHGKNLLHKLLLEGRLIIKQAPLSEWK